uniref:Uncharacterized protein n=1 Tax=Arundo donax TaxID=35708 RepID=A0A0A9CMN8_ARUDO
MQMVIFHAGFKMFSNLKRVLFVVFKIYSCQLSLVCCNVSKSSKF